MSKSKFYWSEESLGYCSEFLNSGDTEHFNKVVGLFISFCQPEGDETYEELKEDFKKECIRYQIQEEMAKYKINHGEDYWGTDDDINYSNAIAEFFLENGYVDEEWFDYRLKQTALERLADYLTLL